MGQVDAWTAHKHEMPSVHAKPEADCSHKTYISLDPKAILLHHRPGVGFGAPTQLKFMSAPSLEYTALRL